MLMVQRIVGVELFAAAAITAMLRLSKVDVRLSLLLKSHAPSVWCFSAAVEVQVKIGLMLYLRSKTKQERVLTAPFSSVSISRRGN